MTWLEEASPWQLLAAVHLFVSVAFYLPSLVAALVRRLGSSGVEVQKDELVVTALKPLRGLDPSLEANLETFARLDAPDSFEVLLVVDDTRDEALPVARRVVKKFPHRFRILVGTTPGFLNPKVASLCFALPFAKNELIWVTDSNTETSDEHLRAQLGAWKAVQLEGRRPTLIHAPLAAVGGSGLGARFERLHLATSNSVSTETTQWGGFDAVVGKSLFFHRDDLAAVGGLETFGSAGGEDFLLGRAFHRAGAVRCAREATRQVLAENLSVADFWWRQARWAKLRQSMVPWLYAGLEHFTCFGTAWLWLLLGVLPWQLVGGVLALKALGDAALLLAFVGEVRPLDLVVSPLKELLFLAAWASAFFTREVSWRGRRLTVISGGAYGVELSPVTAGEPVSELGCPRPKW